MYRKKGARSFEFCGQKRKCRKGVIAAVGKATAPPRSEALQARLTLVCFIRIRQVSPPPICCIMNVHAALEMNIKKKVII